MANDSIPLFTGGVFIPEVVLYNVIKDLENKIRTSVSSNADDNILHKVFDTHQNLGSFNYLVEAIKLFSREKTIDVKVGFNIVTTDSDYPRIYLSLPFSSESRRYIGDSSELEGFYDSNDDLQIEEVKERMKKSKYSICIIGTNGDLVTLLYYVFDYLILANIEELETVGLNLVETSGSDLTVERSLVPSNLFMRSLMISAEYAQRSVNLKTLLRGSSFDVDKIKLEME